MEYHPCTKFSLNDCIASDEGTWIICPNGVFVNDFTVNVKSDKTESKERRFKIDAVFCNECPLKKECHGEKVKESSKVSQYFCLPDRYDAV